MRTTKINLSGHKLCDFTVFGQLCKNVSSFTRPPCLCYFSDEYWCISIHELLNCCYVTAYFVRFLFSVGVYLCCHTFPGHILGSFTCCSWALAGEGPGNTSSPAVCLPLTASLCSGYIHLQRNKRVGEWIREFLKYLNNYGHRFIA